jgi:beta-glucosidase
MRNACVVILGSLLLPAQAALPQHDRRVSEMDARAARIVDAMTLEEQISLFQPLPATPNLMLPVDRRAPLPPGAIGSAGFLPGTPRLGWPALQESDGPLGVANIQGLLRPTDEVTAMPSSLAWSASFDTDLIEAAGQVMGAEAHAKGFNVMLSGGLDLARDPRNGRNFEYAGEDPLLAGITVGSAVAGMQSQHIVSTVKHFAFNDQETGRGVYDARIDESAARESDLLAFEIAIEKGHPGAVMCSYNKVNGDYSCENDFLLNRVLKGDWRYRGWVMSDWGGVHSLKKAIDSGLDQQSPQDKNYFAGLKLAVEKGEISRARIRDMAFRIVRSVIAVGAFDDPAKPGAVIDRQADSSVAQIVAEEGTVLLKNDGQLPLGNATKRVALIGGSADMGVLSGGGGSMVNPWGGIQHAPNAKPYGVFGRPGWVASSPLKALRGLRADLDIVYDDGKDPARAAAVARTADVAFVFATTNASEAIDSADLSLPDGQDALIAAVAAANSHTGVVLETGNPVTMPWLGSVKAVLEAWYPGQRGGEAIADLLTGKASPSGHLPITFPKSLDQLPRPKLDGFEVNRPFNPDVQSFAVNYNIEGSDVGYRWFERKDAEPLFPFGYGLTYTTFSYSDLKIESGQKLTATFTITNTGKRKGIEVAQLYVAPPGRTHRLAAWSRVSLNPGHSRTVTVTADSRLLASYTESGWRQAAGTYDVWVSPSARLSGLHAVAQMPAVYAGPAQQ